MANECLRRTPTSTGNQRVWTWSGWLKLNNLASGGTSGSANLFRCTTGSSNDTAFRIESDNKLMWYVNGTSDANLKSDRLMRDVGNWTHIMGVVNTTTSVSNDRVKIYVNGSLVNKFSTETYPSINYITSWNGLVAHTIGATSTNTEPFEGEMFDVFFVDGQALTPDVFGFYKVGKGYISVGSTQATDFRPGQWVPKTPRVIKTAINNNGGFGVNGFYLPMNDSKNFGADFHCDPNSIITLNEKLPQPRVGVASTAVGIGYTDALRADPYAANLVLALPFVTSGLCTNGTNVGVNTGFGDYSAVIKGSGSAKVAILNNNVSIANTASYYGSAAFFDGTTDSIRIPLSSDFDFGSGNFTLESWVYVISGNGVIFSIWDSANNQRVINFQMGNGSGTDGQCPTIGISLNGSTATFLEAANNIAPVNQWHHVAAVRENTKLLLYLNGVCVGINTNISGSLFTPVDDVYIGAEQSGTGDHFGYIQDLRIYKGVAKYTGGFDVPRPYTPVGIATWRQVPDTTANNFATLNPLSNGNAANSGGVQISYTNGNNTATWSAGNNNATFGTVGINIGRWYWEGRLSTVGGSFPFIGISSQVGINSCVAIANNAIAAGNNGVWLGNGGISAGDIVGVAVSFTSAGVGSTITFFINNTAVTNLNYIGNRSLFDGQTNTWIPSVSGVNGSVWDFNFGQNPTLSGNTTAGTFTDANGKGLFKYQPPSGFLALCEDNLPTPAIANPGRHFRTVLWTGDGNSGRSIVGVGFTPDLVWVKLRDASQSHYIFDSVRGSATYLQSDLTGAEIGITSSLTSFNSDGFSYGNWAGGNYNTGKYVAWCWKAGAGTTSTNTNGSITSVVSVNQDAGFSVVSYTGNGTDPSTIGHGLGKAPGLIIVKGRDNAFNWAVYHKSLTASNFIYLNTTSAAFATSAMWNTNPTSSVFSVGNQSQNNSSTIRYIAYCWAEIEGYSKFGSYVGNGNADGPFIFTNGKPAFVMIKRTDSTDNWRIYDNARGAVNGANFVLYPNLSNIEDQANDHLDYLSNGFKLRSNNNNASSGTYIYACWMESPFQTANAK